MLLKLICSNEYFVALLLHFWTLLISMPTILENASKIIIQLYGKENSFWISLGFVSLMIKSCTWNY